MHINLHEDLHDIDVVVKVPVQQKHMRVQCDAQRWLQVSKVAIIAVTLQIASLDSQTLGRLRYKVLKLRDTACKKISAIRIAQLTLDGKQVLTQHAHFRAVSGVPHRFVTTSIL